jgi:hypothetical protein
LLRLRAYEIKFNEELAKQIDAFGARDYSLTLSLLNISSTYVSSTLAR